MVQAPTGTRVQVPVQTRVEVAAPSGSVAARELRSCWRIAPRHAVGVALLLLGVTFAGLGVALPLRGDRGTSEWIVHGVALGMTEREVQTYFTDGLHGTWSDAVGCSGPGLEWRPKDSLSTVRWARFEFRDGALVSMLLRGSHEPHGPLAEATSTAVRGQRGSEIWLIDRSCVAHRAEADQIAWIANARRQPDSRPGRTSW
jgi:hypothetical protein